MSTTPLPDQRVTEWPSGVWTLGAAALLAAGVILHALFPRYQITPHGGDNAAVVVFDRWTGQFQRAAYGPDGEPRISVVVRPF
jgi:hypothetical protein